MNDRCNQTGVLLTNEAIRVSFNLPLNDHSTTFEVIYRKHAKVFTLLIKFYGMTELYNRWAGVQNFATLFALLHGGHSIETLTLNARGLSLSVTIEPDTAPTDIISAINAMNDITKINTTRAQNLFDTIRAKDKIRTKDKENQINTFIEHSIRSGTMTTF